MEIPKDKKLDILLTQLQERYDAIHKMRDRSMQFVLWILGLGLGMAWLLINETILKYTQQWTITFLLILLGVATLLFVYGIECGFEASRKIIIKIETALKFYEKDFYIDQDSVLPSEYNNKKKRWTDHYKTLYVIITSVFVALIVLTWTNPCKLKSTNTCVSEPNQIQIKNINK